MRKLAYALAAAALVTLALVAALLRGPGPSTANASSHREAPLISEDPSADNTDLYAFRSPRQAEHAHDRHQLHPRRGSGGRAELLHVLADGPVQHLRRPERRRQAGRLVLLPVQAEDGPFFLGNTVQPYTVTRVANGKSTVIAHGTTPTDNIGPRSTPELPRTRDEGRDAAAGRRPGVRRPA